MWNLSTYDCECNKTFKIDEYPHISTLVYEYEILNTTTETSLFDIKVTWEKIVVSFTIFYWLFYAFCYSLSFLLVVIATLQKHWLKNERVL